MIVLCGNAFTVIGGGLCGGLFVMTRNVTGEVMYEKRDVGNADRNER